MLTRKQESRIKQADGSNTEATLILCGYSGELANKTTEKEQPGRTPYIDMETIGEYISTHLNKSYLNLELILKNM